MDITGTGSETLRNGHVSYPAYMRWSREKHVLENTIERENAALCICRLAVCILTGFIVFLAVPLLSYTGEHLMTVLVWRSDTVQASDGNILCVLCKDNVASW